MNSSQEQNAESQGHPTARQWKNMKSLMYELYMEQGLPLPALQEEMARRGHLASCRMYKSRFDGWGWGKNTLKQDWQGFVILRDHAKAAGVDLRQVRIHQRIRNLAELARYLRSLKTSEASFLEEALGAGVSVPDHVQGYPAAAMEQVDLYEDAPESTKPSKDPGTALTTTRLPHLAYEIARYTSQDASNWFDKPLTQIYQPQAKSHDTEPSQSQSDVMPTELCKYLTQAANPMNGVMAPGPSFDQLSDMAERVGVAVPSQTLTRIVRELNGMQTASNFPDPIFPTLAQTRQGIGQVEGLEDVGESNHLSPDASLNCCFLPEPIPASLPDPTIKYVQTEQHHGFMGAVFMACMSKAGQAATKNAAKPRSQDLGQDLNQDPTHIADLAKQWMDQALLQLKTMCLADDPMFLVTINMILVWLQVHDTESRAETLINDLSQATVVELGKDNPISVILGWMTFAVGKRLPSSAIGLEALRKVAHHFHACLGPEHPHTLVAKYCMCFHMIRVDHKYTGAETELIKLYRSTSNTLGKSSFQSVCVLATMSRAQSRQGKHLTALETISQCLEEAPLGLNHPHRLELLIRKALIYWNLKDKLKLEESVERLSLEEKIIRLYSIVVMGRVATLGRYHEHTEAAHETLVEILVESGRYENDTVKGDTHELLTKRQVAVSAYECWWWSMVRQHREGKQRQVISDGMG